MGKYKAGDRVKILAGHPYMFDGDIGTEEEGVYVRRVDPTCYRGKHMVEVTYGDGDTSYLTFKGRELELLPLTTTEEAWVPKVGDRVRLLEDNCGQPGWGKAGETGTVISVSIDSADAYVDFDVSGKWHAQFHSMEPVAAEAQPAGLQIEAGKFYRTRDGRKAGPLRDQKTSDGYPFDERDSLNFWSPAGKSQFNDNDLVAEWVDEPVAAVEEVAVAKVTATVKVGDRVIGNSGFSFDPAEGVVSSVNEGWIGVKVPSHDEPDYEWAYPTEDVTLVPEPAASPAKFKVGDRVKIVSNSRGQDFRESDVGKNMTVTTVFEDGSCGGEESSWWWPAADLELVNSAKPANDNHEVILTVDSPEKANLLRAYADLLNAA